MRRFRRRIAKWTGTLLDLPKDILFDLPRITMIGNMQTYIENHRGVVHFSDRELKLNLTKGSLQISGENLVIRAIWTEEVFVEGKIEQVKYIDA